MGQDIFQNGGFVENLKFGRKNRSFLALLEVIFMFSFWKCVSICVRVFKYGGCFWPI